MLLYYYRCKATNIYATKEEIIPFCCKNCPWGIPKICVLQKKQIRVPQKPQKNIPKYPFVTTSGAVRHQLGAKKSPFVNENGTFVKKVRDLLCGVRWVVYLCRVLLCMG